jgi:hypothetical protein
MSLVMENNLMHVPSRTGRPSLATLLGSEPWLAITGLAMIALMMPTFAALLVDDRLTNDISVWTKPLKFQVSLALYTLTLAFFARYLPQGTQAKRWYRVYMAAVIAAIGLEMVWLMGAAIMGVPAHFNGSASGQMVYRAMGLLATLLTSATAVYAFQIARNPSSGLSPAVKSGIVWGLALTLPLTLITAGILASGTGHWVGGVQSDAGGMTLMGWARDGGDLRVAHFFGTHAMHILPIAGLFSAAVFGPGRVWPVRLAALGLVVFTGLVLAQALAGRPFLPMIG